MRIVRNTIMLALGIALVLPSIAQAKKTTYIATNHRFNYVKLKEVKPKVAKEREMTHPKDIDSQGLRSALASIKLARSYVIKKEVDTQDVFDESALDFLSINMAKAFSQAGPNEEVVFSYLSKQPLFILRNDRLNLGKAWIHNDELHVEFKKLYAKVTGDIDKRGNEAKAIARSRGLRIKLELGPGQMMSSNDPDEVILNMHYNYAKEARPEPVKVIEDHTMAGEVILTKPEEAAVAESVSKKSPKEALSSNGVTQEGSDAEPSSVDRLRELEQLKKDGLITKKEYTKKRKEILGDL